LFDLASSGSGSERNVGNNRMDDALFSKYKHYNLKHNQDHGFYFLSRISLFIIVVKCDNYSALGERSMFLVKINVRETEGAISNVHYKDTGNNKRKRNRRGNHECTLQRYRQHRAQDTKRRQTKQKHNT
jgi:hypothetical protein